MLVLPPFVEMLQIHFGRGPMVIDQSFWIMAAALWMRESSTGLSQEKIEALDSPKSTIESMLDFDLERL